jgi:shikimate dehydrogenase
MVAMRVSGDDLATTLRGLRAIANLSGLVFTIPHKMAMVGLVDDLAPNARLVGAINAARRGADGRWIGDMFDGRGCVAAARRQGHDLTGRTVLQVGAGGVGRAVAFAFAEAGIARLTVNDAREDRARALARDIAAAFPEIETAAGAARVERHDTVVNCTPLGMETDDPLPLPAADLGPGMLVIDVVLSDEPTPLLAAAAARGSAVQDGAAMLAAQVGEIARFFGITVASAS